MNAISRVLLSVFVAAVAGLAALLIVVSLGNVTPPTQVPVPPREPSYTEIRLDEALGRDTFEAACKAREDSVWEVINRSKSCSRDSDCTIVHLGCPFGCSTAVMSTIAWRVEAAARSFRGPPCPECVYGCVAGRPMAQCLDGKCTVKLLPELARPEAPPFGLESVGRNSAQKE